VRVLHVYSGNLFGGIETILLSLARHAAGSGAAHAFALCFDARLARELRACGADVRLLAPVRVSRPRSVRDARRRLASHVAAQSFDTCVVHAPWSHALFASIVRRTNLPLTFWAHDAWRGRHWTERWARRTPPDLVVANSAFTAETMTSAFPGVPCAVVHAPLDVAPATLPPSDRAAIRAQWQTSDDAVVVVQASRLEAWKGHATLLQALAALRDDRRWTCWIVGGAQRRAEREYEASLRARAIDLGIGDRVRFAGERDDVPRVLAAADIYCQPNAQPEPFGIVFVEALAAGLPVVTSGIGGAPDIVDASCGRLVPPADADRLRDVLAHLIADRDVRASLGRAGPSRAAMLCDPTRQLRRLHELLPVARRMVIAR